MQAGGQSIGHPPSPRPPLAQVALVSLADAGGAEGADRTAARSFLLIHCPDALARADTAAAARGRSIHLRSRLGISGQRDGAGADLLGVDAAIAQDPDRDAVVLAHQAEEMCSVPT
jgi:hypothetical protein